MQVCQCVKINPNLQILLSNLRPVNSKCCFGVFTSQKNQRNFSRVSALASKQRSYQKSSVLKSQNKILRSAVLSALIFWLGIFLEARAEILKKNSLGF